MLNFEYSNTVKVLFGKGQIDKVAQEILPYGKRILFLYGNKHIKENGVYDRVTAQLKKADITWVELSGVHSNPRLDIVQKGIDLCRREQLDFILAVGGGSTSDSAKAIGMGVKASFNIWEAYTDFHQFILRGKTPPNLHVPTEMLPIGVVMTKPATGSEFDYTSVLSNWETHEKLMVINKVMYPKFAIQDPTLAYTLPQHQRAFGIADIMTHYFEQYFTKDQNVEVLDRVKEAGIRTVIESGKRVFDNPEDYTAQGNLLYCAAWACSDKYMCGTAGGWDAHMIEHEISALTDLNHGHGMAIVYLGWMKYMLNVIPAKFGQYAEYVWGIERRRGSDYDAGMAAIERTAAFWRSLNIPLTLKEAGVDTQLIPIIAKNAVRFGPIGLLKPLQEEDIVNLLELVR